MESFRNCCNSLVRAQIFGLAAFVYDIALAVILAICNGLPLVGTMGFSSETIEILRITIFGILLIDFVLNLCRASGLAKVSFVLSVLCIK